MKKLLIVAAVCAIFSASDSLFGLVSEMIGVACLLPIAIQSIVNDNKPKKGDKVIVSYWKLTRCGTEEESNEPFTCEGILSGESENYYFVNSGSIVKSIMKSKHTKISRL